MGARPSARRNPSLEGHHRARRRDEDPRQGGADRRLLRRRLSQCARCRQPAKDGLHERDLSRRRVPRMERAGPAGRTRLSLRRPLAISLTLALAAAAAIAAPTPATDLPPGCWGPDRTGPILAKTLEVRLAPDLSSLSEGERAAV